MRGKQDVDGLFPLGIIQPAPCRRRFVEQGIGKGRNELGAFIFIERICAHIPELGRKISGFEGFECFAAGIAGLDAVDDHGCVPSLSRKTSQEPRFRAFQP